MGQDKGLKIILKEQKMSSNYSASALKLSKPISKGNRTFRKVNKLASRLRSKGVPSAIVGMVDSDSEVNIQDVQSLKFEEQATLQQMKALAKIQSIEALTLSLDHRMGLDLKRSHSEVTEASPRSTSW